MYYTDRTEALLSGFDKACPTEPDSNEMSLAEELEELMEANADWEMVLWSDIDGGRSDDVRADRATMQKNRLRIREIKKILSEQKKREESMNMEESVA